MAFERSCIIVSISLCIALEAAASTQCAPQRQAEGITALLNLVTVNEPEISPECLAIKQAKQKRNKLEAQYKKKLSDNQFRQNIEASETSIISLSNGLIAPTGMTTLSSNGSTDEPSITSNLLPNNNNSEAIRTVRTYETIGPAGSEN